MPTGKQLCKIFLVAFVSLFVAFGQNASARVENVDKEISEGSRYSQQKEVYSDVNSTEVGYVQESELAQEMRRAQKEHNAKTYDSLGGGISIIAMCIVVTALAVLSILFMIFGRISSSFIKKKKKQTTSKKTSSEEEVDHAPDTGETIAAITAALAQHFDRNHDIENTILTIHKMRKAYSPWNSKIYNMRHTPELTHISPSQAKKK